jgi:tetratricopeptide (TPR) repeat protein
LRPLFLSIHHNVSLSIAPLFIFCYVLSISSIHSQSSSPKSYALVIGVSKYQDPKITSLKHAHKDATNFSDFCTSPSGLNIPDERIRILTDEKASYWNIVDGLDWLKNNAQRDDQVYIYFSGHGDMESKELKYGYLLTHDSRYMNYLGRSLSLDLLNKTAHTLTVNKRAKVFLITDACHSGKLAGVDFNGSNLVALNLMQLVSNNEVRITSCNEGELSYEDEVWGNGRGAFSYFLTKGMAGEADGFSGKKDKIITIEEIKSFLNKNVPVEVRRVKRKNQNPVVMGSENFVLNTFEPHKNIQVSEINTAQNIEASTSVGARSVSGTDDNPLEKSILKIIDSNNNLDYTYLSGKPDTTIVYTLLEKLWANKTYELKVLKSPQTSALVAKILHDKVQHIINLYLEGDAAELEKRRFYRQIDKPYDQYPYMVEIAIKLLPKDHILIPSLQMMREYLNGLALRLKVPFTKDYMVLIDSAFTAMQSALSIDSTAAYIHNEMGILYIYKKNYSKANHHFLKANILSPQWSLPYSNLANTFFILKDNPKAKEYLKIALEKQQNLQSPYLLEGDLYVAQNNLLFAEEHYQKAIHLNDRYYYPYEKLGILYLNAQDYVKSNEYFYEADLRKAGLLAEIHPLLKSPAVKQRNKMGCDIDSTLLNKNDIMGHFLVGKDFFDKNDYQNAQIWFEKVAKLDKQHPLVYHYLGQTEYFFKSYAKAEFYFKLAMNLHLPDSVFRKHVAETSLKSQYYEQFQDICLVDEYEKSYFLLYDSRLYLARTYEKWGNYINAAEQYNECINIEPTYRVAFYMLWNMYKNKKDLVSAENTIQRFGKFHPHLLDDSLADFYKWVIHTYQEDLQVTEHYSYKYGLLMHHFMMKDPERDWGASLANAANNEVKDFSTFIHYPTENEKVRMAEEAVFIPPARIENPVLTGVAMLNKVTSISIDKTIRMDAYTKIGDIYSLAKLNVKAIEYYEKSLSIDDKDIGIRSKIITFADQNYLFQKASEHLNHLYNTNQLGYEGIILLAKYNMKSGDFNQSENLYKTIENTHPLLQEMVKKDIIIQSIRFKEYQKTIDLIHNYLKTNSTDITLEYMLARTFAGLNKPDESLTHLQNAINLGFNLAYTYKNDPLFDPYRALNNSWIAIQEKMEGYIIPNDGM